MSKEQCRNADVVTNRYIVTGDQARDITGSEETDGRGRAASRILSVNHAPRKERTTRPLRAAADDAEYKQSSHHYAN